MPRKTLARADDGASTVQLTFDFPTAPTVTAARSRSTAPSAMPAAPRHWIAVASAEHVAIGRAAGFMQVCHGRCAPLKRLRPGDRVAYYSPTATFLGKDTLQAFTALGEVISATPYQADMGGGFHPFRHDVRWWRGDPAPIRPLLPRLTFSAGRPSWGQVLRFGLFQVPAEDFALIATAMAGVPAAVASAA